MKKNKTLFSRKVKTVFLRGLAAILPSALTVALVFWIFMVLEKTFRVPFQEVLGEYYFPGLGIIVALILIFFIGAVINNWIIQKLYSVGEKIIRRIPLIKTIYNSIYDVMQYFSSEEKEKFGSVVLVTINGWETLGFITRELFDDIPNLQTEEKVAVYIPFSYQIGGFTFFIPRSQLKRIDLPVDQAMRFIITAGMIKNHEEEIKKHP